MGSTKTQETKLPQWQEDFIRENILPMGLDIAETPYTPYTGETIASMTPIQNAALSGIGGLDMGGQTYDQAIGAQSALASFGPSGMGAVGAARSAMAPDQIAVDQLASTNLGSYMSPYTQNVIDRGQMDIERQRQMASNTLGAQAQAAGAFGGSRQAVQEGVLAGEALRQSADLSAAQRQQAFNQALQSAQFDIGETQAARTLASQQGMTAATLGQQAREAAAARAQAANAANYQGQFAAAGIQSAAANAMGSLAGNRLQSELAGLGAQMAAGEQQRALEQAQLQADYAMFQEQQAYPMTQLNALLSAGSGIPTGLGTVTQRDPFGMLNPFGSLLGGVGAVGRGFPNMFGGSDTRLKENIKPAGKFGDFNFYTWDWNDVADGVVDPAQPTFGVMAQEVEKTHPDLVVIGADGFRRVNYGELYNQIGR